MDLKWVREAYILSETAKLFTDDKKDNSFLRDYLVSSGRLEYTTAFVGKNFDISAEELPFVFATEECLKILVEKLNTFLREPYCTKKFSAVLIDSVVSLYQTDLVVELENLKKIEFDRGWKKLYEDLSPAVCKIEGAILRLVAVNASGQNVLFISNTKAEDFLSPKDINFHFMSAKYFVAAGSAANKARSKNDE